MKAVQVMLDPAMLARLDALAEVKKGGRSSVIRAALAAWLDRRREAEIVAQYARAYGEDGGLGDEWTGWERQGRWPSE